MRYNISMIPDFVAPFLWSYDVSALDLERDKKRIITNVLNLGTTQATDWLFAIYAKEDIADCIAQPLSGEWSRKSLYFWAFVLGITPGSTARIIP